MSRGGELTQLWGDAERTFRLGIGDWRKVQETCDAGPAEIAARLSMWVSMRRRNPTVPFIDLIAAGGLGSWRVDDVREPIYRGLIGGGMDPTSAGRLMIELHDSRPLTENIDLALAIVLASLVGADDETVGEPQGEGEAIPESHPSPEASFASPTITERVQ